LLEFILSSNPRSFIWIDLHICVVACKIFGCRWFLHCIHKVWFFYFLQIQVFHSLLCSTFTCSLIRHKCQGDPDPSGHPISRAGSSGPWSAAKVLQNFKVILFTRSFQAVARPPTRVRSQVGTITSVACGIFPDLFCCRFWTIAWCYRRDYNVSTSFTKLWSFGDLLKERVRCIGCSF
jgi:hypothetical protein